MAEADPRPIARLRRLAASLGQLQMPDPVDAAWLVAALQRYEAARRSGMSLDMDAALGLGQPGHAGWWRDELRVRRDALLRELWARHFGQLKPGRAAAAITRVARAFEAAGLHGLKELSDPVHGFIAEALLTGQGIPGQKQVKRILESGHETRDFVSG